MKRELLNRTKRFAIDCWYFCAMLPKSREYNAYVNQLIRFSSSVGANFRSAQRAKSKADFIYKLKLVEEETDESLYWLEIFQEISTEHNNEIKILMKEANELLSIMVSSIKMLKNK